MERLENRAKCHTLTMAVAMGRIYSQSHSWCVCVLMCIYVCICVSACVYMYVCVSACACVQRKRVAVHC